MLAHSDSCETFADESGEDHLMCLDLDAQQVAGGDVGRHTHRLALPHIPARVRELRVCARGQTSIPADAYRKLLSFICAPGTLIIGETAALVFTCGKIGTE
jgi:hypothetical protein